MAGTAQAAEKLVLVDEGMAKSVIVTADTPSPVADYAAQELAKHIEKATGTQIPIITESGAPGDKVKIYVGATKAAEAVGLIKDTLQGEDYRIRAVDGNLFILGQENAQPIFVDIEAAKKMSEREWWASLAQNNGFVAGTRRGTIYGAVAFLDRFVGVKWLWPGELGTYVPRTETLAVSDTLEIKGGPAFAYRNYRIWSVLNALRLGEYRGYSEAAAQLAFSPEGVKRYAAAVREYLLLHQAGSVATGPEHMTDTWGGKHFKTHPEFFALMTDGKTRNARRLCVSNPELPRFLVENEWDGGATLPLGEGDDQGFCRCKTCMEWDAPQPAGLQEHSTANRYVRFAQAVYALAVKRNPNVKVGMLLYMDYTHAPTITPTPDLSWMYGHFVPWGSGFQCYYPMSDAEHEANKAAWLGWSQTGMEMVYRPNHLLGYTMPNLSTRQAGDMIRFAAAHGMRGFEYDSLWGQWAVKGPMLYMTVRLGTNPKLTVDEVRAEYFSAFGPAAKQVEAYFDYWENYSIERHQVVGKDYENASKSRKNFPPEAFAKGQRLLTEAMRMTGTSKLAEFAARVQFLKDGLAHAELEANFAGLYEAQQFDEARNALRDLMAFRRVHEKDFIADFGVSAFTENATYKDLTQLLNGKYTYFSDPGLQSSDRYTPFKKFKREDVADIQGLAPSTWGLVLSRDVETGMIAFKYEPATGKAFAEAFLEPYIGSGLSNTLALSDDGTEYRTIATDIAKEKINLTEHVKGKRVFYLRLNVARKPETEKSTAPLAVIRFKVSFTSDS
jgi:hypothetical protein